MSRFVEVSIKDRNIKVVPVPDEREWFMTLKDVAKEYEVSEQTIHSHITNHPAEFVEGYDKGHETFVTPGGAQVMTVLYKTGVVKVGFHVHNPRGVAFRNYAAQLVLRDISASGIDEKNFGNFLDTREDLEAILKFATGYASKTEKP